MRFGGNGAQEMLLNNQCDEKFPNIRRVLTVAVRVACVREFFSFIEIPMTQQEKEEAIGMVAKLDVISWIRRNIHQNDT